MHKKEYIDYPDFHGDAPIHNIKIEREGGFCSCGTTCKCKINCDCESCGCLSCSPVQECGCKWNECICEGVLI